MDFNEAIGLSKDFGFKIFPCNENKVPLGGCKWKEEATTDLGKLREWSFLSPYYAGIKTGPESGIFVVDIDVKEGKDGLANFKAWLGGRELPKTVVSRTQSGGYHYYFRYPVGSGLSIGQNVPCDYVDYRGNGGYVIAYDFLEGRSPFDVAIADMPDWLFDAYMNVQKKPKERLANAAEFDGEGYRVDGRDEYARDLIYALYAKHGENPEAIMDEGWDVYARKCGAHKYDLDADGRGRAFFWEKVCYIVSHKPEVSEAANDSELNYFNLTSAGGVEPDCDATDFVEGLLLDGGLSVVYGPPASGKTFFITDIGMRVAMGYEWRGREVEQGPVIYCAMEAQKGINNRVAAWKKYNNIEDANIPFEYCSVAFSMLDEGDVAKLINTIKRVQDKWETPVRMVIIDTMSRSFVGGDENISTDMNKYIEHVDIVRRQTDAHVCLVHHSGKDVERGMRGHSSLKGAIETEIAIEPHDVEKTKDEKIKDIASMAGLYTGVLRRVHIAKQKELETIKDFHFTLPSVSLGLKHRYGRQTAKYMTSCVVKCED